jgi:hypothetical protein
VLCFCLDRMLNSADTILTTKPGTTFSTMNIPRPVDASFAATNGPADDVESPSLSSSNALARFEFEPGRSKEGTKVLMVEWEDDDTTRTITAEWEISWEGKRTVLPAQDQTGQKVGSEAPLNRLYFLLGAGVAVPTTIGLKKGNVTWRTNPLPAIFSPELGATAREAGKKGVLHTIWAKKRLQVLQSEIDLESKENMEGVGYQMALAEKEWIEANFGVSAKPTGPAMAQASTYPRLNSPTSPRSPGGGRLMEKLKGLKLGTSNDALSQSATTSQQDMHNPLSPVCSDVALGSFGAFAALKGMPDASTIAAKPAQAPQLSQPQQRRIQAQRPPDSFGAHQRQVGGGMGSLNAVAADSNSFGSFEEVTFARGSAPSATNADDDKEDDLFALPMSPRSPEMSKSPFSFAASDTGRYLPQQGKA